MGRVRYNQSGYVGTRMSVRAMEAYDDGEMPKSRWTKKLMLDAIEDYCDAYDLPYDGSAASMKKAEIFDEFFEWKSWHHTGKFANVTDFYGLNEDAIEERYGDAA